MLNVPCEFKTFESDERVVYDFNLTICKRDGEVRFSVGDVSTSWMSSDDDFTDRITFDKLNPCFRESHLAKEIEIRNVLERGIDLFNGGKFSNAMECFDDVLYYDFEYGQALLFKSRALFAQRHFVKSLRYYKRAVRADASLKDVEYHKLLLKKSSEERDHFPKIKTNIYVGDEFFAKGDYLNALESYERALANPTDFKTKILSKLLNKKATALLKLHRIGEAVEVFKKSVSVKPNDYAYFYLGLYEYDSYSGEFKRHLDITKKQLLRKAHNLHEHGENDLALECLDEFFLNHYQTDEDYIYALRINMSIFDALGRDPTEIRRILINIP